MNKIEQRQKTFLKYVDKAVDGHWYWLGCLDKDGYGISRDHLGKKRPAHVVSFILFIGNFNPILNVLHKCDIRRCVNPDCLFQGTQSANIRDCVAKGRHAKSKRTHCKYGHPLTADNVYLRTRNGSTERRCKICCKCNKG